MNSNRIWTKDFMVICISSFFIFLNFYMLAAALPLFVKEVLNGSKQQMGLVITLWSLGCVLMRLFSGRWVDRFGMKKLSVISLSVFVTASFVYFGVSGILLLLVIRAIHGGSFGVAATSTSALATDIIPESRKGEGIGYFSMFMSIAMVVGPALGIMLWNQFDSEAVLFTISAGISCLALIFTMLVKKDTKRQSIPQAAEKMSWRNLIEKKALPIAFSGMVLAFSYSSLTSFITAYSIELHQDNAAGLFFIVFAVMIIISRPLVGKIFDRYGGNYLTYPGVLCFAIGMLILSQADSSFVLLLAGAIIGLGHGALVPSFQTLAIQSVSSERRGAATATFFLLFDFGYGLGSFILGLIAGAANYRIMFLVACVVVLLSAFIYYFMVHRRTARMAN
ncbi:MFS transporter [Paenibacillus sp. FSL H8-0034]|uniref:MFS transporter n=1 Tax=Paenibacillus sp. FSL H8-0034 TaxID=2954671 RepID=UPI0030FD19D4